MRNTFRLAPAEGVAPGVTATINLPGPRCYHDVTIQTSFPRSQINAIRIVANNRTAQEYTGEAIDVINAFDGRQKGDDTYITIPFDQTGLKVRMFEELTAFNVGSMEIKNGVATGVILSDLEIQIDIDASANNPRILNSWATISPVKEGGPGALRTIYRLPGVSGVTGRWDYDKLPKGTRNSQYLSRLFIKTSQITELEIERDGRTIWERTAGLNTWKQNDGERFPQAGWFVIDFSEEGYGENKLDCRTARDLRLKLTSAAAENVEMFAEYIGELEV
ncbi:major capsid protein P2 [Microbulbifer sp. PSTR4-B]|uniref:major capsid protein P2 n=1 Tax=Microbulbifer sp. PSTR4-B TaxID=3243396 RepID=UPI0040395E1C